MGNKIKFFLYIYKDKTKEVKKMKKIFISMAMVAMMEWLSVMSGQFFLYIGWLRKINFGYRYIENTHQADSIFLPNGY